MKIVFFGTSNFALPILEALHNHHDVVAVVTTPDSPVGRKQKLTESPVSALAHDLEIPIHKPASLKNNDLFRLELENLQADLFVVASYGKIIPEQILNLPKLKTLNAHPSLLPRYRGPTPIQTALMNGDEVTGTSIMLLDAEVDHGPVLTEEKTTIDPDDSFFTLSDKLARMSAKLLFLAIPDYSNGKLIPAEQNHAEATFTKIITKQDGKVDWQKTATQIYNQFRAFYPWPGIWTTWNGKVLKITDCVASTASYAGTVPGTVLPGGFVACGQDTALQIKSLQLEGKTETDIASFLNGYKDFVGSKLD